jgi:hypothetical protein
MADGIPPIVLNANQRRHFEVLFARLEDSLTTVEDLLTLDPGQRQVLTIIEHDIPDAFREQAAPIIAGLRERIIQLAAALELHARKLSRARSAAATLSAEAIRIEDSLSPQLRGYGEVHDSVARHLDPVLAEMARTLGALAAALRAAPNERRR